LVQIDLAGTNTYLLGRRPPYILLDTGEGQSEYIPVLERALTESDRDSPPNGVYVSDVILSHKHPDHHGGLHSVLELLKQLWTRHVTSSSGGTYTPPRLHKFASFSKTPDRWDTLLDASLNKIPDSLVSIPPASCGLSGSPEIYRCHGIKEGQEFILTGDDSTDGSIIRTIHTPGHTDDSICLYLREDQALFTFDSVLGHGTAVFENLSQYISSLRHLLDLNARGDTAFTTLYPGHGPVVEGGEALIQQYIAHRLEREEQLVSLLGSRGDVEDRSWTADQVLEKVYPPHVWAMARRGILLHLHKLEADGKVLKSQREGVDIWTLL
jgi:ribonuclease/clavin/mitogillin